MAKAKGGISKGLKALFIIHGIAAFFTGLGFLLMPVKFLETFKYVPTELVFIRYFGAVTLALSFKDWICLCAKLWSEVRIIVLMEIVWTLLATLLSIYLLLFAVISAPLLGIWVNLVIYAAFFVAYTYFYIKYR